MKDQYGVSIPPPKRTRAEISALVKAQGGTVRISNAFHDALDAEFDADQDTIPGK